LKAGSTVGIYGKRSGALSSYELRAEPKVDRCYVASPKDGYKERWRPAAEGAREDRAAARCFRCYLQGIYSEVPDGACTTKREKRPRTGTPVIEAPLRTGTDAGATGLVAHLIEAGYRLPPGMWPVVSELYRQFMAHGGDISALMEYLADHGLQLDELPAIIRSLFDGPKPLAELQTDKPPAGFDTAAQLKTYLGDPPPGYEWHHIIEQNGQTQPDLTSPEGIQTWIQNTDNVVMVPVIKHYCINSFMSSAIPPGSGIILRNTVRDMEPEEQRKMGIILLMLCRVTR
jgi:hypothetical protein